MPAGLQFQLGEFYGRFERRRRSVDVELSVMSARGHVERHTHEDAHFVLVIEGGYVTAADEETLGPMSVVYNPPGVTHRDHFVESAGRFACLSVKAEIVEALRGEVVLPPRPSLLRDPASAIDFLRRALDEECDLEEFSVAALAATGASRTSLDRAPPRWLQTAIDRIDAKAPAKISIAQLAAAAGVHPVHFTRVFRAFTGETPSRYAASARMKYAYALMRRREMSLAEIAAASGYADQSHLSRAFSRATRSPAAAFRKGRPAFD